MKLFLMRHGQSFSTFEDPKRGLTPQGSADVLRVVKQSALAQNDVAHIMHSGVPRTEQTASIVAKELQVSNITSCSQWLAENADIDWCVTMLLACEDDTLLVSHQPFLMQLVHALLPGGADNAVQFSVATLVCLEKIDDDWVLRWVKTP